MEKIYFSTAYPPVNLTPWNEVWISDFDNITYDNVTDIDSNKFTLPLWRQILWYCLFVSMIIVATGGNLIVIWIVLVHKRMKSVTNIFLVNLSIADTLVSMLNVTFNFYYMLHSHWTFGNLYCKVSQFISVVTICASVFTLMAISIDRYRAIIKPLRQKMSRRTTLMVALIIWVVSSILSLPNLIFFNIYTVTFPNGDVRLVCYGDWPNKDDNQFSLTEYIYNVLFMVLTYFLPIGSMTYTYARIGLELWGSQSIGEITHNQLESIKGKRRVVKMMIVIVSIFAVCWLPFHVYFIVVSSVPEVTNEPYIQEVYLAIYWLAMSNSMYNPMIYCWMNSKFRRGFSVVFRWCPGVHVEPEHALSRSEVITRYSCTGSPIGNTRISRNGMSCSTSSVHSLSLSCASNASYFNKNPLLVPFDNHNLSNIKNDDDDDDNIEYDCYYEIDLKELNPVSKHS
ncbi:tachykinin-like peptides receptor 99D isoform X1 [Cotesia glomerata]|uniref:tachykinin-like peptides receptor 99D isoform X1 n=1 Tax=Cotesia glomerata TaxID=32391 RepID=UPI001D020EA5|nr:tachykinin-like peptides receptor 99D isoform X1 [Cotesia glomerata]XP_044585487.1 tachykinin-like peptides receptor 99D isoform X1 [Cotesia glomerata]XP_044585488.1 tachykinin-like peptides receptor 99D isoform X1 [Cotesia glomerata]XP_044585489.1 tachykinin-like peptides receptor 99D isoform X1 [Cotesia glomerata]XP_044585490.1 tachykinin-like peptides receptor 99D isoform X1 [Cotesia glomerata]XP_044585491.1 tachykinin-like peptides receptor 99D isoform X1 [Cotesia glomerata]